MAHSGGRPDYALLAVCCFTLGMGIFSSMAGRSWLFYSEVRRKDEPVAYWIAMGLWWTLGLGSLFLLIVPTCFDPDTLLTSLGACRQP